MGEETTVDRVVATHTPFGCVGSHKNMEQQSQGWCESDATNRWFRLYEKKEFAFFLMYRNQNIEQKWGVFTTWFYQKVEQYGGFPSVIISSGFDGTLKFHTL